MKIISQLGKMNIRNLIHHRHEHRKVPLKKKIVRGSVASLAGISILMAGVFQTPSDLLEQEAIHHLGTDSAVEIVLDEPAMDENDFIEDDAEGDSVKKRFFRRATDRIKAFVLGLPLGVRVCVCLPLWAAGYAIVHIVSWVCGAFLMPALSHILSLLLLAIVLLTVFTVTMKSLFPNMPLKKILCKRNILIVCIGAVILKVIDFILPLFWADYMKYKNLVLLTAGFAVLAIIFRFVIKRLKHKKEKDALSQVEPEVQPEPVLITQYYFEDELLLENRTQKRAAQS